MQAGDGSSGVAGSRPCLGCDGTGRVGCYGWGRVLHCDSLTCDPCPVCLGAGTVTDPDTSLDAKVDAASFCAMEASLVDFDPRPKQPSLAAGLDRHRFGHRGLLIVSILLALTFGARPAAAGDRMTAYALWCGAKAADLATTELAFSRGGYESNPLMKDRGVRIGAGAASCVVAAEADHRLRKHTKSRWAVRVLGLGLMAYAVQRNARVGQ